MIFALTVYAIPAHGHTRWTASRFEDNFTRMDWRHRIILTKLGEGYTYPESASAAGISRQGLWKWTKSSPDFAQAVAAARDTGKDERTFRAWLRHPFRGKRPPTGKGHSGKPAFRYGRR